MSAMLLMVVPLLPLGMAAACFHAGLAPRVVRMAPVAVLPALAVLMLPDIDAPVPGLLLDARMLLDATARVFLGFTALLWGAAAIYARAQLAGDPKRPRFFSFFLAAMAGNLGLIVAGDALGFYLWFTLMSFAAYGLVVHDGDAQARRAARAYMTLVVLGELLLFAGLVMHGARTGGTAFSDMAAVPMAPASALLLLAAFAIKAGAMPLHMWLPLAHPAAPVPASAVLSGAMIKAGLLGWIRFLPPEQGLPGDWGMGVAALGLAAAVLGVALGLTQTRAKTLLAYSSVSQMGFMLLGLGAAWQYPALAPALTGAVALYALHHALAKGALFLGVGVVHAGARQGLVLWLFLALPALALAGLPLSSGTAAKHALKAPLAEMPALAWLEAALPLAALGTTLLMARYLWLLRGAGRDDTSAPPAMLYTWGLVVAAGPLIAWSWTPARAAGTAALSLPALFIACWPLLLGGVLAVCAMRWPKLPRPSIPEGDLWVLLERVASAAARLRPPRVDPMQWWEDLAERVLRGTEGLRRAEPWMRRDPWPGVLMLGLLATAFWLLLA